MPALGAAFRRLEAAAGRESGSLNWSGLGLQNNYLPTRTCFGPPNKRVGTARSGPKMGASAYLALTVQ
jgi:hypothetical protein